VLGLLTSLWALKALISQLRPIYDIHRRIIACLAGQPQDFSYAVAVKTVHQFITAQGEAAQFKQSELQHDRGHFPVINVGVTHGNGTTMPINLNNQGHSSTAKSLLGNPDIQRLASFADGEPSLPAIYTSLMLLSP
jgi:hypothetical protein